MSIRWIAFVISLLIIFGSLLEGLLFVDNYGSAEFILGNLQEIVQISDRKNQ
jgi:hypothetical protein